MKTPQRTTDLLSTAVFSGENALEALELTAPVDDQDMFETLLKIYQLQYDEITPLDNEARYANHPKVSALRWELENAWLTHLRTVPHVTVDLETFLNEAKLHPIYAKTENEDRSLGVLLARREKKLDARYLTLSHSLHAKNLINDITLKHLRDCDGDEEEIPEIAFEPYRWEFLAAETYPLMLSANNWLTPEALGAWLWRNATRPKREERLEEFKTHPTPTVDTKSVLDNYLSRTPEWGERALTGAVWAQKLENDFYQRLL